MNVSYDEGSEERTDEVYDPAQTALVSSQKSEQTGAGGKSAQGVPGTASNTPAAAAVGAVQGSEKAAAPGTPPLLQGKSALPVFPQAGGGGQSMHEESGTYAVTKHLVHTEQGPGRVRRVTAAVVVNDRMTVEGVGKTEKTVWKPRTTEEMHRLETLAQAAVGFDERRGDQVVLENVSFSANAAEPKVAGAEKVMDDAKRLLLQPAVMRIAVLGTVGLVLVWFVLKPIANHAVATMREPLAVGSGREGLGVEAQALAAGSYTAHERASVESLTSDGFDTATVAAAPTSKEVLVEVTRQIKRQPRQSTRLLETWIAADGESD